ncbi:DUF2812 domain-containing protein [Haloimpatiens sp. FM7315]|uniref:DUF2812 domain-containing protein n=1 Tax=Haloimpatiens sp. FM7315 TaxID=3298609 RepID=UPI003709E133
MEHKYVMVGGLAFSENSDMKKLENYASKGWILQDIVGGFFYKLKKDKPQSIIYSLDYQNNADEEYFSIFKEAGWNLVVSGGGMYIFSAPAGTKPIYSNSKSEIDKYVRAKNSSKKGVIFSLAMCLPILAFIFLSAIYIKFLFPVSIILLMIDVVVFVFSFMPYLSYKSRIKNCGEKYELTSNKIQAIVFGLIGIAFLIQAIKLLLQKRYLSIVYIILGLVEFSVSVSCYKNYKKQC